MNRKFAVGTLFALILIIGVVAVGMAAGPDPNGATGTAAAAGYGQGAALYGDFIDENGDGICDTYGERTPAQDGTGSRWGTQGNGQGAAQNAQGIQMRQAGQAGAGVNFVDADGDGICDTSPNGGIPTLDGTGSQMQRGG